METEHTHRRTSLNNRECAGANSLTRSIVGLGEIALDEKTSIEEELCSPYLVPECLQLRLVTRVKRLFGLDDDAVLRASTAEYDGRSDLRVPQHYRL